MGKKKDKNKIFVPRPIEPPEVIEARWKKKRDRIHQLSNKIRSLKINITKSLKEYLSDSTSEKEGLTSLVVAVMMRTGERIGNKESANEGHFGVTLFLKSHVVIIGNKIHLSYVGKAGVPHDPSFSDETISKALKKAIKNSPTQSVFCTSDEFQIRANRVNSFLKNFGISGKDIRGFFANKLIIDELKKIEPEEDEKKRKKQLNKILKKVAAKVGHGRPTLKKHYMIPELWDSYMKDGTIIDINEKEYYEKGGEVEKNIETIKKINENEKIETKIIDSKGKPLVLYQGYDKLDDRHINYFALSESEAKEYGKSVRKVHVILKNPIEKRSEEFDKLNMEFEKKTGQLFDILYTSPEKQKTQKQFYALLKRKGYDGITYLHENGKFIDKSDNNYVVSFSNSSIKEIMEEGGELKIIVLSRRKEFIEHYVKSGGLFGGGYF